MVLPNRAVICQNSLTAGFGNLPGPNKFLTDFENKYKQPIFSRVLGGYSRAMESDIGEGPITADWSVLIVEC